MTYKQFIQWCNNRACDGRWSINAFIVCKSIIKNIEHLPFWKRKKEWLKIKDEVEKDIVSVTNKKYGINERKDKDV